MGAGNSQEISGVRVFKVSPGGPAAEAGLEVMFDFITEVNGTKMDSRQQGTFAENIKASENKAAKMVVYNVRAQREREVQIVPRKWTGTGLLGATVRFDAVSPDEIHGVRVLEVFPNSPAAHAGLVPFQDYMLGTMQCAFRDIDELVEVVSANLRKRIEVYVYNSDQETVREVLLVPNNDWGGDGCIGCDIGTGLLHRIPAPRRVPGGVAAPPGAVMPPPAGMPVPGGLPVGSPAVMGVAQPPAAIPAAVPAPVPVAGAPAAIPAPVPVPTAGAAARELVVIFKPGRAGMQLHEDCRVAEVAPSSQAELGGVRPGMRMLRIGDAPASQEAFKNAAQSGVEFAATFIMEGEAAAVEAPAPVTVPAGMPAIPTTPGAWNPSMMGYTGTMPGGTGAMPAPPVPTMPAPTYPTAAPTYQMPATYPAPGSGAPAPGVPVAPGVMLPPQVLTQAPGMPGVPPAAPTPAYAGIPTPQPVPVPPVPPATTIPTMAPPVAGTVPAPMTAPAPATASGPATKVGGIQWPPQPGVPLPHQDSAFTNEAPSATPPGPHSPVTPGPAAPPAPPSTPMNGVEAATPVDLYPAMSQVQALQQEAATPQAALPSAQIPAAPVL